MALAGKMIGYVDINARGDVFRNLFKHKQNDFELILGGQKGAIGSTICWDYTHDGKKKLSKQIIESVEVDGTNHKIVYKVIEGELVEIYKSFKITFHVEPKGNVHVAAWTFEFEKPNTSAPYPTTLMDYLCGIVEDLNIVSEVAPI